VLSPGALIPWLDQAYIERVVFAAPDRVEVSAQNRLFTGATRRAMEVRDLFCKEEGCEVPGDECEGDHIVPYHRADLRRWTTAR